MAGRNRLRFQFNQNFTSGNIIGEADLVHNYLSGELDTELLVREIYFEKYYDNSDLRIGRQLINWGRTTGGFVTDIISPTDLREFLTLSPEDFRLGVTAIDFRRYFSANSLQFIFSPIPEYDRIPDQESRWFPLQPAPSPVPYSVIGPERDFTITYVQAATRFSWRSRSSFDLDAMLLYWHHPIPAFALEITPLNFQTLPSVALRESYRNSPIGGFSFEYLFDGNWKFQTESLFVYERLFTFLPVSVNRLEDALEDLPTAIQVLQEFEVRDDGYLLKKPWLHSMIGVETDQLGTNFSLQFYLEKIFNYEERILPQEYFPYATLFAARPFLRDRLQVTALSRYNFYAKDFWFQLQGTYEISDGFEATVGTNLFGGEAITPFYGHFTFNQFRENSFIFSRIAVYF
ncbi:hypothetical protein [Rhodohalobacter halophilus]|uniref:hypothetical protein n=1 Tax=Rhodohalobacter halophilus TaxID=1812810 RepID=UPI00083FB7F5|nr:hypothetical protein [Rhodohalobacter halophilus]